MNRQCLHGARGQSLALLSDHGGQPTSLVCMRACATLESHPAVARDHHSKGNTDTERVMRTLKEECLWLTEWPWPAELLQELEDGMASDNAKYLHAALGYKTPRPWERDYETRHGTPFVAA